MIYDLQKASMGKRISAFLFDVILFVVVVTAAACILSAVLGYDGYSQQMEAAYAKYEAEYDTSFQITQEEYNTLPQEEKDRFDAAYNALITDQEAMHAYETVMKQMLWIIAGSTLLAYLLLEFAVSLFFGNGQTLGKKIFGVALIRKDGVKITSFQVFTRAILGKYLVETMIPVAGLLLILFSNMGGLGLVMLLGPIAAQIILLCATRTNSALHDIIACTVAVDLASQMIFKSPDDLIAYQKKVAAENAAKQDY